MVQNVEEMLYSKNNEPKSVLKDLLWLKLGLLGPQGALSALQPWCENWGSSLLCCFSAFHIHEVCVEVDVKALCFGVRSAGAEFDSVLF